MGMFDSIKTEKKLPVNATLNKWLGADFDTCKQEYQTKDLGQTMNTYRIKKSGTLLEEIVQYRQRTDSEKADDIKKYKRWGNFGMRVKNRKWVKSNHSGNVEFYAGFKHGEEKRYYTINYIALIVKGRVKNIKLSEFEREGDADYTSRLEMERKWAEEMRRNREKTSSFSYKIINFVWNSPLRIIFHKLYNLSHRIPNSILKLERTLHY